jgi:hypothetical protein
MRERPRSVVNRHQEMEDHSMKNLMLAALAALSLSAAVVPAANAASTAAGDAQTTRMQQTGAYGGG